MKDLMQLLKKENSLKRTENGALALKTSGSALLDLFASIGVMRESSDERLFKMYEEALYEDELLALRLAFYTRDIKEGLGERDLGRKMFLMAAKNNPASFKKNLELVSEYGRYDDLVYLLRSEELVDDLVKLIFERLMLDLEKMGKGEPISLLGKWLPSINTSSFKTREEARFLCAKLGMKESTYRKVLASLRSYLNVTEKKMSEKSFKELRYDAISSYAIKRYRKAFYRHDRERFENYLKSLEEGKGKINAKTLYPYDILMPYMYDYIEEEDELLEAQWKALPDFTKGENYLIMADVSGSMIGRPMATSVGLALYFAMHNKGVFHNKFMTFSKDPAIIEIREEESLLRNVKEVMGSDWGMNTDLEKAFLLVLDTAVKYDIKQEEMPKAIIVISDMEIDRCTNIKDDLFYEALKEKFLEAGYKIPRLVFWNVASRQTTLLADKEARGVELASGQGINVFKHILANEELTPYDVMYQVLNSKRYQKIVL